MRSVLHFIAGAVGLSLLWWFVFLAVGIPPDVATRIAVEVCTIGITIRVALQWIAETYQSEKRRRGADD